MTPLVILRSYCYIEDQWLVRAYVVAGIEVAYNWIKGVLSTYCLLAASVLFVGTVTPVSVILAKTSLLFTLSSVSTDDPLIVWLILSESM